MPRSVSDISDAESLPELKALFDSVVLSSSTASASLRARTDPARIEDEKGKERRSANMEPKPASRFRPAKAAFVVQEVVEEDSQDIQIRNGRPNKSDDDRSESEAEADAVELLLPSSSRKDSSPCMPSLHLPHDIESDSRSKVPEASSLPKAQTLSIPDDYDEEDVIPAHSSRRGRRNVLRILDDDDEEELRSSVLSNQRSKSGMIDDEASVRGGSEDEFDFDEEEDLDDSFIVPDDASLSFYSSSDLPTDTDEDGEDHDDSDRLGTRQKPINLDSDSDVADVRPAIPAKKMSGRRQVTASRTCARANSPEIRTPHPRRREEAQRARTPSPSPVDVQPFLTPQEAARSRKDFPSTPLRPTQPKVCSNPAPPQTAKKSAGAAKPFATLSAAARQRHLAALALTLVQELNEDVFDGRLPSGLEIVWSNTLRSTAGRASWRKRRETGKGGRGGTEMRHEAKVELSRKVIDDDDKLRNTLAHELCHLATWVIDGDLKHPHGTNFKRWGRLVHARHPDITVTTKHSYEIAYKFRWRCKSCSKVYGRHSNSIDISKHACGECKGRLEVLPSGEGGSPTPGRSGEEMAFDAAKSKPTREASSYQNFVKGHFAEVRKSAPVGSTNATVMKILAQRWKERKEGTEALKPQSTAARVEGEGSDEDLVIDLTGLKLRD